MDLHADTFWNDCLNELLAISESTDKHKVHFSDVNKLVLEKAKSMSIDSLFYDRPLAVYPEQKTVGELLKMVEDKS